MGIKLYPTYYIVIMYVKIIKLPSMLSTEGGLCGVLGARWLSSRVFCPTCQLFIHILRVRVGSGPWSGRSSLFFHACEPVYMETQC